MRLEFLTKFCRTANRGVYQWGSLAGRPFREGPQQSASPISHLWPKFRLGWLVCLDLMCCLSRRKVAGWHSPLSAVKHVQKLYRKHLSFYLPTSCCEEICGRKKISSFMTEPRKCWFYDRATFGSSNNLLN